MARVSKRLKVYKTKHEKLGEIIELYSPRDRDGSAAYFLDEITESDRESGTITVELGMGLRLTKKTALALAEALKKLAKEIK